MKKLLTAVLGLCMLYWGGNQTFALDSYEGATDDYELPQGFTFYNKVSSNIVEAQGSFYNNNDINEKYQVEFAGISEKVGIEYSSEKLWFELAPEFSLTDNKQHWNQMMPLSALFQMMFGGGAGGLYSDSSYATNNDDLSFAWTGLDWGIRFTPFDIVDFVLHHDTWTPGGYLPIVDQHVGGNLTGDGVGVVFKPIDGLRLGMEIPFTAELNSTPNYLNAEFEDLKQSAINDAFAILLGLGGGTASDYRLKINAGADYKLLDMLTIGAFVTNIINRDMRGYSLYANLDAGFVNASLGYTYNGSQTRISFLDWKMNLLGVDLGPSKYISGHHKINLAATASFGDFSASFEALFNVFKTQSFYDLYAGAKIGYDLLPGKFNIFLAAGVAYDFGNKTRTEQDGTKQGYIQYAGQGIDNSDLFGATKKGSGKNKEVLAPMLELQPGIVYDTGRNEFGIKVNLQYYLNGEGSYNANFPVYWKYTF